ncbi:MAG TPA: alpha/beta fold hydrolase [Acidimicrobiales bacterium]|nr:alpha/beta fold hydrolase [Acidimicrobiales bacterium]
MTARPGALVLHGLTGSTQSVAGVAAALADAGFEVEAPMLPGHGTTPEELAECGWADWTAAAEAAYRRLAVPAVAVGLSMGGALAAGVCARHPEVRGLAVVNPLIDPPAPAFLEALEGFLAAGERFLPGIGSDIADPSAREVAYDRLPVAALLSASRGLGELRPRLGDVRCPVLILSGRHDHVVPSVSGDVLAGAVSGPVERVWLERSAHVATLDLDREELERRVVEFSSRAAAGSEPQGS